MVERRLEGPSPESESLLKLELRSRMLEIDKRIAMLQAEEYRRLLLSAAVLGGGGEPLSAAVLAEPPLGLPEPRRCLALLPAAAPTGGPSGSSSQALMAQAAPWPLGPPSAVAAAATGPRESDVVPPPPLVPVASGLGATPTTGSCHLALPSTLPPLSSQLDSGDVSGSSTRGRGKGRGRGRGRTGYANVATSSTESRLVCNSSGLLQ